MNGMPGSDSNYGHFDKLNDHRGTEARLNARTPVLLQAAVLTAADFFLRVNCFFETTGAGHAFKHRGACIQKKRIRSFRQAQ